MDDVRRRGAGRSALGSVRWIRFGQWLCLALGLCGLAGCSLFVMAGKMIFGDPVLPAAFEESTGVDLTKGNKKVVVLCSAPTMVDDGNFSLNYEIVAAVSRRLKRQGVRLIDSNRVRTWMDDYGGYLDDPRDLAEDFDVDYIIYIALGRVTFREENSPSLYRGTAGGEVFAYEVQKENGQPVVREVFSKGFNSTYPDFHPVSADQIDSLRIFQKRFLDRISAKVARLFYDHKASDEIF